MTWEQGRSKVTEQGERGPMGGVKYRDVGAVVKSYQKECRITFIYENALLHFFFKPCIPNRYFYLGIFE